MWAGDLSGDPHPALRATFSQWEKGRKQGTGYGFLAGFGARAWGCA